MDSNKLANKNLEKLTLKASEKLPPTTSSLCMTICHDLRQRDQNDLEINITPKISGIPIELQVKNNATLLVLPFKVISL